MVNIEFRRNSAATIFAVLFMLLIAAGCSGRSERDVVVIKKTGTYHRADCPPVHMAKTTIMSLREARADRFKPCAVCKPDSD